MISKEQGLSLLAEYEALLDKGELPMIKTSSVMGHEAIPKDQLRPWLAKKVASGQLTRVDQLRWLASMFPEVPQDYLDQVAGSDVTPQGPSIEGVPWNRRKRRTIAQAKPGDVLLHVFSGVQKWRGPGIVLQVDKCLGSDLLHGNVYQHLLSWATQGVFGGVVGGVALLAGPVRLKTASTIDPCAPSHHTILEIIVILVVVKIMVPFGPLLETWHLTFRVPKKGP